MILSAAFFVRTMEFDQPSENRIVNVEDSVAELLARVYEFILRNGWGDVKSNDGTVQKDKKAAE